MSPWLNETSETETTKTPPKGSIPTSDAKEVLTRPGFVTVEKNGGAKVEAEIWLPAASYLTAWRAMVEEPTIILEPSASSLPVSGAGADETLPDHLCSHVSTAFVAQAGVEPERRQKTRNGPKRVIIGRNRYT